ncbi:recombination-associated protein RdgC [Agrobacterium tumefaciens]|nr:recombination-associated protein RdgC [Agrobacterium tumefaciens]
MKAIKNAIAYSVELPSAAVLAEHLKEMPFEPVGELFISRAGFVKNPFTGELVTPLNGGLSFSVRYDEKILPSASVRQVLDSAVADAEKECGHELEKDEREAVKERARAALIATALVKTVYVHAFYHFDSKLLILPTTAKPLAGTVVGLLARVMGSIKTTTIHVSDVKSGLTARLVRYLDGDDKAYDGFKIGESCVLKEKSNKVSIDIDNLDHAKRALREALDAKMQVETMQLVREGICFKLTSDFRLRSIEYLEELTEDEQAELEGADAAYAWRIEATIQLLQIVDTVKALCELFDYKAPQGADAPLVEPPSTDAIPEEDDQLYEEAVAFVRESRRASISAVQRKLKVGYNRACRLIERMEIEGITTPMDSHGGREVIG